MVVLHFTSPDLSTMKEYLKARADPGETALFMSRAKMHPEYRETPFTSSGAWRMIQKAAKDLGLPHIHPHDFLA